MSSTLDRFPSPEDWVALQGGMPTILGNLDNSGLFLVVHDYGSDKLPQHGLIVATPSDQMQNSLNNPTELAYIKSGRTRGVRVPAVLLAQHHGLPCNENSYRANIGRRYDVLGKRTIQDLATSTGLIALKLSVLGSGQQFLKPKP